MTVQREVQGAQRLFSHLFCLLQLLFCCKEKCPGKIASWSDDPSLFWKTLSVLSRKKSLHKKLCEKYNLEHLLKKKKKPCAVLNYKRINSFNMLKPQNSQKHGLQYKRINSHCHSPETQFHQSPPSLKLKVSSWL